MRGLCVLTKGNVVSSWPRCVLTKENLLGLEFWLLEIGALWPLGKETKGQLVIKNTWQQSKGIKAKPEKGR